MRQYECYTNRTLLNTLILLILFISLQYALSVHRNINRMRSKIIKHQNTNYFVEVEMQVLTNPRSSVGRALAF